MFELLRQGMWCGTALLIAFIVLLAMPQSKLREIVLPFIGFAVSALSIAYIFMPLDVVPDFIPIAGGADDLAALAIAIASARTAWNAGKAQKQIH
jgi:hypothetical protein